MVAKKFISGREYARRLKVDDKVVRNAIKKGLIIKGYDKETKKIEPVTADREWGHLHKVVKPKAGVSRVKAIKKMEGPAKESPPPPFGGTPPPATPPPDDNLDNLLSTIKLDINTNAAEAMRIREVVGAMADIKKLQEAEGKLVQRHRVDKVLHEAGNELKKALFNIPQRAVREIMAAPNEVVGINILTKEITDALNSFINLKPNFESE